jgi:molybdopterin/thiamine biosynthesis adenylyltransferase
MTEFTDAQLHRYARHIVLQEIGGEGQRKLLDAKVLVVGAGGLGSPLLLYLGAAGIGTIGVIDDDAVDLSNLQRQVLHTTDRVGVPKVESAAAQIKAINPDVTVIPYRERLTAANVMRIIADYDLVADGSDNFATRFLVNDACYLGGKTLISGALLRFEGQLATFKAHLHEGDTRYPCYRCIFPEPPPRGLIPSCAEGGVLGSVAGTIGTMQATEVIKEIVGVGESLAGSLVIMDALDATFRKVRVKPDPACDLCGAQATIRDLSRHVASKD